MITFAGWLIIVSANCCSSSPLTGLISIWVLLASAIKRQTGKKRDERLPEVPTLYELMDHYKTSKLDRSLAGVVLASNIFGRPYVAPPKVPAEQVKILREAFAKMMKDSEFLADAKRRNLEIKPTAGEELEKLAKSIVVQPPEVIKRMVRLLGK